MAFEWYKTTISLWERNSFNENSVSFIFCLITSKVYRQYFSKTSLPTLRRYNYLSSDINFHKQNINSSCGIVWFKKKMCIKDLSIPLSQYAIQWRRNILQSKKMLLVLDMNKKVILNLPVAGPNFYTVVKYVIWTSYYRLLNATTC